MWYVIRSESTGRYIVVKGYYENRKVWVNSIGACDFVNESDARAQAQLLNMPSDDQFMAALGQCGK